MNKRCIFFVSCSILFMLILFIPYWFTINFSVHAQFSESTLFTEDKELLSVEQEDVPEEDLSGLDTPQLDVPEEDLSGLDTPQLDVPEEDLPGLDTTFDTPLDHSGPYHMNIAIEKNEEIEMKLERNTEKENKIGIREFKIIKQTDNGKLNMLDQESGIVEYNPETDFLGEDSFEYYIVYVSDADNPVAPEKGIVKITMQDNTTYTNKIEAIAKVYPERAELGDRIELDGSESKGDIFSYRWKQIEVSNDNDKVKIGDRNNKKTSFIVPNIEKETVLTFELSVMDKNENEDKNRVSVSIEQKITNNPPIADAGENKNINPGTKIMLDGSESYDEDGDDLKYYWTIKKPEETNLQEILKFTDYNTANPSFTIPDDFGYNIISFELIVNDGNEYSGPDIVTFENSHIDDGKKKWYNFIFDPFDVEKFEDPPFIPSLSSGILGWSILVIIAGIIIALLHKITKYRKKTKISREIDMQEEKEKSNFSKIIDIDVIGGLK